MNFINSRADFYRTGAWIYMADCMGTLFNSMPHITLSEMRGTLPCPRAIFETSSPTEFDSLIKEWDQHRNSSTSVSQLADALLHGKYGDVHVTAFDLEPSHMLIMILSKCNQILHYAVRSHSH
jgi:hypothetical protein